MQHEFQDLWQTIDHCLSVQAPEVFHRLQPGATEEQFHHAEAILPVPLPEEVKALYRIHNGCIRMISTPEKPFEVIDPYQRFTSELFLDRWHFHSLEVLCEVWEIMEAEEGSLSEWSQFITYDVQKGSVPFLVNAVFYPLRWYPLWLPFMTGQGSYFIDLMPGPKGIVGQILFVPSAEMREGIAHVVTRSLSEFFLQVANDLTAGRYVFDDSTGLFLSEEGWLSLRKWYPSAFKELWQARKTVLGRDNLPHPDTLTYSLLKGGR